MPQLLDLREDIVNYLRRHGLVRKWKKAKAFFERNPLHPSLNTELLEPKHRLIYSFRIDKKYRALFICRKTKWKWWLLQNITANRGT